MPETPRPARRRRAFRCQDGCFHLQWDSLMLSLMPEEFAELAALLRQAEAHADTHASPVRTEAPALAH